MFNQRMLTAAVCMAASFSMTANAADATDEKDQLLKIETLQRRVDAMAASLSSTPKTQSANAFNPAIALNLSGLASYFKESTDEYSIPGFGLGEESGPGEQGLSLGESELTISANIDNLFYGQFTVALTPENETEIEEAYIETLTLPGGLTTRFGRLKSGVGYLNSQHSHVWDFIDAPLVYRAFMANQYADDGLRLTWLAPTDVFLEFGAEAFRGESAPAGGAAHNGVGAYTLYAHVGGDVGISHSWQAGLSRIATRAAEREMEEMLFSGDSTINIADLVWKWSPNGNPYDTQLKLQMEYLWGNESGNYEDVADVDMNRDGWYAQAIYQFSHRWRVGMRYSQVSADDPGSDFVNTYLAPSGSHSRIASVMLDFANSEFSRLRLQFNRDQASPTANNQLFLQYTMSLGAHGGHQF